MVMAQGGGWWVIGLEFSLFLLSVLALFFVGHRRLMALLTRIPDSNISFLSLGLEITSEHRTKHAAYAFVFKV